MVKGDILGSHNADKRCLTLDFKQPKRICKMQDQTQQQKQQSDGSGDSPDWASSLALTTPELDDKVSQFASQFDLFEGLPTPTTTSMLLPSPGSSLSTLGVSHYSRASSHNQDNLTDANNRTINFSSASLTPTSDIERQLQQIQSLQTPLFEPIRDILASGQQSAATSPTAGQQASGNNVTTLSNYNLSGAAHRPGDNIHDNTCNNDDNNHRDNLQQSGTHNNEDNSNSTYNHNHANQRDTTTNTTGNHRQANQRDSHDCTKTDPLLPTPLFELDEAEINAKNAEQQRQQQNTTRDTQQQQSFSDKTAPNKRHDAVLPHQQDALPLMNNNSENDMLNINIPLSVRRISDQSCSSSMDSSYSPKFLPLTNSMSQMSNNSRQQQQQPYLLLATDGNIFSSNSPDQHNSMIDSQDKMKIERKRERNRLAASKCRKRKVERITQLEEQVAQLEERLKRATNELERHKKSGCRLGGGGEHLMQ